MKLNPFMAAMAILIASSVTMAGQSAVDAIRKEDIASLIQRIDQSVTDQDLDGLMRHIARDAEIRITVPAQHGSQLIKLGYNEYRELMRKTFADTRAYTVHRHDTAIHILPDGKAQVTGLLFESIQMKARRSQITSHEKAVFALVDGQVKLITLDTHVLSDR